MDEQCSLPLPLPLPLSSTCPPSPTYPPLSYYCTLFSDNKTPFTYHSEEHRALAPVADSLTVAEHYNRRSNQSAHDRRFSPVFGLKQYNNWVKKCLIESVYQGGPGQCALDLCCGKGGDFQKWKAKRAGMVVCVDNAHQSLRDAIQRWNTPKPMFPAIFISADCHMYPLATVLDPSIWFDVVSCQFALHYSFENEERAEMLMRNVAERLLPFGAFIATFPDSSLLVRKLRESATEEFGNEVYRIRFDTNVVNSKKEFPPDKVYGLRYFFTLEDAVEDCPEYLVHMPALIKLAHSHGLELEFDMNLSMFAAIYGRQAEYSAALQRMNLFIEKISEAEWEAISLYRAVIFRKVSDDMPVTRKERFPFIHSLSQLQESDICTCLRPDFAEKCLSAHRVLARRNDSRDGRF